MKIQFYLRFHTKFGQSLFITGNIDALGNFDSRKSMPIQYMNNEFWHGTLDLPVFPTTGIQYHYVLRNEDGGIISEWGDDRMVEVPRPGLEEIQVIDTWNHAGDYENAFFTAPFQQTLLKHNRAASQQRNVKSFTHVFKVKAPLLKKDEILCLSGTGPALKEWDKEAALAMSLEGNWWICQVSLPRESFPLAYKYLVYDAKHKKFVQFENGNNRILHGDAVKKKITILHDGFV
ncbi:MAG TPA: carbohydrate-binding module family 20 domain-containing protein, partial [Puia sp.]|nr:carbohydrate-binding module family 20 domain-containing protein [Puia sp.]